MIFASLGLGYLTIETLKGILLELEPKLGDEQLMEIVDEVDEDGSGTIDFDGELRGPNVQLCFSPFPSPEPISRSRNLPQEQRKSELRP